MAKVVSGGLLRTKGALLLNTSRRNARWPAMSRTPGWGVGAGSKCSVGSGRQVRPGRPTFLLIVFE